MKKPAAKAKAPAKAKQPAGGKPAHAGAVKSGTAKAAKPAPKKAAKPAHVSAKVKAARHASAVKSARTRAVNAKKARQLALGSAVACCSAEALAASLRLTGWPVSDAGVLALYWHTARDEHAGASIVATLEAAAEFGLAGVRPVSFGELLPGRQWPLWPGWPSAVSIPCCQGPHQSPNARPGSPGIVLGLALPAPHAVLDTGYEWISWGEAWPAWAFPDVVIEEAWTVGWPAPLT